MIRILILGLLMTGCIYNADFVPTSKEWKLVECSAVTNCKIVGEFDKYSDCANIKRFRDTNTAASKAHICTNKWSKVK